MFVLFSTDVGIWMIVKNWNIRSAYGIIYEEKKINYVHLSVWLNWTGLIYNTTQAYITQLYIY
jgi:hypothetical protein